MKLRGIILLLLALALAGCGGASGNLALVSARLISPELTSLGGKMTSGVPEGIFVTWTRNTEPEAVGYYLYRDTQPIPVPPEEQTIDPSLRTNGGVQVPQPPSGTHVNFTDIFPVVIGTTYYYRVTVVGSDGNESYPSNEMSWLVHGQTVTGLNPTAAFWSNDVTLTGDTFGTYNPATDSVLFQTLSGSTQGGAIVSWDDTEIVATIPDDTITGPVYVVVGGTIASTDEDLVILNPYITAVTPQAGFVEQPVSIFGANFGAAPGELHFGTSDLTSSVTLWSDTLIEITPPDGIVDGNVTVVQGGLTSNGVRFIPKPEILLVSRSSAAPGASIIIVGRYFGSSGGAVGLGGDSQVVTLWQDRQLVFTADRTPGTYALTVQHKDGMTSNDVSFEMLAPLAITISGIDQLLVYRPGTNPTVTLNFPADTTSYEIFAGALMIYNHGVDPPPTEVVLDVSSIPNGVRAIRARAVGRGVTVDSNILTGTFYSLPGDVDGSGVVNESDISALLPLMGLTNSDGAFLPWYDTDGDGVVTEADASLVGYAFGNEVSGS